MKNIGIFSTTRGDMAILSPLISKLKKSKKLKPIFFVGGTHRDKKYGNTLNEIKSLNIKVTNFYTSKNKLISDDPYSLSKLLSRDQFNLANIFRRYKLDAICLVGDRFEKMALVMNAILFKKRIIHLHGGEITLGSYDNEIRNMFSKASNFHFVICNEYKNNLLKMGVNKKSIYNTGSLAVDNIKSLKKINKKMLFKKLRLETNKKTCILNYHPPSLDDKVNFQIQLKNILLALKTFKFQIIVTTPGLDSGRNKMLKIINKMKKKDKNIRYIQSLGFKNFFSLIPFCEFVIGNSSSGIIEVPYFKIPTIDIGRRQQGRLKHLSVINCNYNKLEIKKSLNLAMSKKFKQKIKKMKFYFGKGNASSQITKILERII